MIIFRTNSDLGSTMDLDSNRERAFFALSAERVTRKQYSDSDSDHIQNGVVIFWANFLFGRHLGYHKLMEWVIQRNKVRSHIVKIQDTRNFI